jgi:hypothetical protein
MQIERPVEFIESRPEVIGLDSHGELTARLRVYASNKLDAEVFNHIRPHAGKMQLQSDDLLIVASVLNEAARLYANYLERGKPDEDINELVEIVILILDDSVLPTKPSINRAFREYFNALIRWCDTLRLSHHVSQFWNTIGSLLEMEMRSFPDMREALISLIADIGRRVPLPVGFEDQVLGVVQKPYYFSHPESFLKVLGFVLHQKIMRADLSGITGVWLESWRHHLAISTIVRRTDSHSLLVLKNDIHSRLARMFRTSGILLGRDGGFRISLLLLLIKFDHSAIPLHRNNRVWLWYLRTTCRLLGATVSPERRGRGKSRLRSWLSPSRVSPIRSLKIIDDPVIRGTWPDVIVTRVQGGIGDIISMRPGLVALAKRRGGKRVVFATNRSYFPAFSVDDPIELVDIEHAEIEINSFGKWVNMSDCPATRIEGRELPRVRTNRVDIFARAVGVRFWPLSRKRIRPISFSDVTTSKADELIAQHSRPDTKRIGVQIRSAENYKDIPLMFDIARKLAESYAVFIFDNRTIPRRPDDQFTAVDNQAMPVAMAMLSNMDMVIAPDSSFIHVAGCNGIPCLILSGPTDGKVRRKPYPTVRYLDVRRTLGCIPCWRNEFQKCALSETFDSVCTKLLTVPMVIDAIEAMMVDPPRAEASPLLAWVKLLRDEWRFRPFRQAL